MNTLWKSLFSTEFIIDEPKKEVYVEPKKDEKRESDDLISLLSEVMVENERLADLTSQLEEKSGSPEELMRFVRSLIPFLDSFERVLFLARNHPPSEEIDNWLRGVESIYFRILNTLERFGLKAMETIGRGVNLDMHEVVEYRPTHEYPHNTIITERQRGYVFRGKILRDAKVVVAYNERG
jgi:molecular chaperone GrpE